MIWINFFSKLTLNSVITIVVNDEMMKWWNESKFWVFDPDETFICYRGCLNLSCYMGKKVHENFLMGLKIWWSWGSRFFFFKIPIGRTVFNFSCKTSRSCLGTCSFGGTFLSFFGHFFLQNFSFLRGWEVFLSKKRQFFEMKLHVFGGLGALFGTFFINFLSFFLNVPPYLAQPRRASARSARG